MSVKMVHPQTGPAIIQAGDYILTLPSYMLASHVHFVRLTHPSRPLSLALYWEQELQP